MFYNKTAKFLADEKISDGMGGWVDSAEPVELATIEVASAPVNADTALREYGIVTTTSMKLYTTDTLPEGYAFIHFQDKDYRVLQVMDYDPEKMLLVELI